MSGKPIPDEVVAHVCDRMLTAAIGKDWRKRAPEAVTAFWMGEVREALQEVVPALTAAQQQGQAVACGGCGNADPEKVCIGCLHPFAAPPSAPVGVEGLVSALRSMRDRMMTALPPKFGDAFDGDFDTLLEAINAFKAGHGQNLEALAQQPAPSAPVGVEEQQVAWTDADMEKPCGAEVAFLRRLSEAQWVHAEVGGMLRHSARLLEHRATELRSIYDLLNVETGADAGAEIARLHALAQQPAAVDGAMARMANKARQLQRKFYGDACGLHLEMIDWAREFDALATQHQEPTA